MAAALTEDDVKHDAMVMRAMNAMNDLEIIFKFTKQ